MNRTNKKYSQGFAVVRVDTPVDQTHPENSISVLKIFGTKETANAERDRLSRVNVGKECLYFAALTRLVKLGKKTTEQL